MRDFEKEAEEYLKKDGTKAEQILDVLNKISPLKITSRQIPFILAMIQQVFKDGAEFGYNYALNDTEAMLKSLKDKGVIKSWYYNGTYHVGNELPLFKEN